MRIAHVTSTFPPYQGGTGNVCYYNARELARRGHDVHIYTAAHPGAPPHEQRHDFNIHRLRPLLQVGNAPLLPQLLHELRGFDLIHLHYPFFGGETATLAAKLSRTPLVITYHQDVLLSGTLGLVEKVLRSTFGRWTLRSAERVLFTSGDYGQASYVRPMLRGRESYIGELPNGVDIQHFTPGEPPLELVQRCKPGPEDRLALLVAALDQAHYFKGVAIFLEALAGLPANCKGVIVGEGDLKPGYQAAAEKLGLGEQVSFPGRVPDEVLPFYYQLADVTTLPSVTMGEAFGLVLIESLACGTPVIASDLPGVRTVVADGEDGFLAKPGDVTDLVDKLTRLLSLPEKQRHAMGQAGRQKVVERYSWERIGDRLESIYQAVLEDPAAHTQADQQVEI